MQSTDSAAASQSTRGKRKSRGVPNWLLIVVATATAIAALVGAFVGLYPLAFPDHDSDVAYQKVVAATCARLAEIQARSPLPVPVGFDRSNRPLYAKAEVIAVLDDAYAG